MPGRSRRKSVRDKKTVTVIGYKNEIIARLRKELSSRTKEFNEYVRKLERHSKGLEQHSGNLESLLKERDLRIGELEGYVRDLERHSKGLEQHSGNLESLLKERDLRIGELEAQICKIRAPLVSIIVVNYNGYVHLPTCLGSLRKLSYPNYEVILIDNGSTDGSYELAGSNYPEVRRLRLRKNRGFAVANNIAVEHAGGEYVAFLNNDTEVDAEWLSEMVRVAEQDKSVAACASKLLMFNARQVINSAGGGMTRTGLGFDRGLYELDGGKFDRMEDVIFASAGAMLLRKSVFRHLGGFDKKFFMYHEDVDLGWRIWLAGYRVVYVPTAKVYHKYGATSGTTLGIMKKAYLGERYAIRSLLKNAELATIISVMPHLALHSLGSVYHYCRRSLFLGLSQASFQITKIVWNVMNLPSTARERLTTQRMRVKRDKELLPLVSERLPQIVVPDYPLRSKLDAASLDFKMNRIEFGVNDQQFLGYGWYPLESSEMDPALKFRWTREEAHIYVSKLPKKGILSIEMYAIPQRIGSTVRGRIEIENVTTREFELQKDGWQTVECTLPGDLVQPVDICIITDTLWKPSKVFGNADPRTLGIGVKSITWQEQR
jgi:hypothetical protein